MLNEKRSRFVEEYSLTHCAAEAARRAGYSAKTARSIGHELLTIPDVQAAIQARQEATALELGVTKQKVITDLLEAIQVAREQRNPGAMIQSATQIGKLMGFYTEEKKIDITINGALAAKYQEMTDQQLTAIIDGQAA